MVYFNKEKVKSIILVILILTSLVQVGILWVYQSHRLPFSFFSTVFGRNSIDDNIDIEQKARKEILIPYRIIVSNGNNTHWLLKRNDEIFHILWNEGQEYVKRALNEGGGQIVDLNIWGKLVVSKSFVFEFKEGIKSNLVRWFLNIPLASSAEHSESIRKIIILPDEDINKNNTVYILTNKNLYKYILPFAKNNMSREEYKKIVNRLELDKNLIEYNIIKEIDPNNQWPFKIPSDVLCVVKGPKYKNFASVTYSFGGKVFDIEEKAAIVLGNEKESYDRYIIDRYDTLVFKNLNNTYRLYSDGMLEYKYTPGAAEQDKGDIGSAFVKAYIFINRIKNYLLDSDGIIYLAKIKEDNPNYYEFVFDYMVDGYPVYIDYELKDKDNDRDSFKNAITIKVDSKRIIECNWLLISIDKNKDNKEYNVYFQYMLDEISKKYGKQKFNDFAIGNTMVAYLIDSGYSRKIDPIWIINKPDNSYYHVPMIQKKDD